MTMIATVAWAATGTVNTQDLNMREGASTSKNVIKQLAKGTEVNIPSSVTEISTAIHGYKFKVKAGSYAESFFSQEPDADYTVE